MRRLQNKLLLRFLLVVTVPMIIGTVATVEIIRRQVYGQLRERLDHGAQGVRLELEQARVELYLSVKALSQDEELYQAYQDANLQLILGKLIRAKNVIGADAMTAIGPKGTVLARAHTPNRFGDTILATDVARDVLRGHEHAGIAADRPGIEIEVALPVRPAPGSEMAGVLKVGRLLDYAFLQRLKTKYGLEAMLFDGRRLQGSTLVDASALADAEPSALLEKLRVQEQTVDMNMRLGGKAYFINALPLLSEQRLLLGTLLLALAQEAVQQTTQHVALVSGVIALCLLLATAMVCSRVSSAIVRPVHELSRMARRVAKGDMGQRVQVPSNDEIGQLAVSLNHMTEELQTTTTSIETLNEEITTRKQTEEKLACVNQQLMASEQQLRASNQQLMASEQQLRASNQQLKASEEKYRHLYNSAAVGMATTRISNGKMIECNHKLAQLGGYDTREECIANYVTTDHYVDPNARKQMIDELKRTGEVKDFEAQLTRCDGVPIWVSFASKIYPKEGYLESVVVDITERKQAQEALRQSEEKYRSLIQNIPDVVWTSDEKARTRFISSNVERVYGFSAREIYEEGADLWLGRIHPEDVERVKTSFAAVFAEGIQLNIEYRIKHRYGHWIWLHDRSVGAYERDGVKYADGVFSDITERKQAEETLKMSELRIRSLIEQTSDAVFCYEYDPPIPTDLGIKEQTKLLYEGVLVECNDVCARSYGAQKSEEVIGRKLTELFSATPGGLDDLFAALIQGGYRIIDGQGVEKLEDGTERYYLNNGHGIVKDGKLIRMWGTFRDITERRHAEEAQKTSEQRLELAQDAAGMGMFDWDIVRDEAVCNDRYFRLFGLKQQERMLSQEDWLAMVHPDDRERAQKEVRCTLKEKSPYDTEYRVVWPDKSIRWISSKAIAFYDEDGIAYRMIGAMTDTTGRKQAEEALKHSEERFRVLSEAAFEGIGFSEGGVLLDTNEAFVKMYGYSLEELKGRQVMELVAPEHREFVANNIRSGYEGVYEHRGIRKDGSVIDLEIRGRNVAYHGRKMRLTAIRDITERKQAEEALRESEERARALLNATTDSVLFIDRDGRIIDLNDEMARRLGKHRDAMIGTVIYDYLPADLAAQRRMFGRKAQEAQKPIRFEDQRAGRWLENSVYPVLDAQGEVARFAVYSRDITERKQAKEALHRERRLNEELFKTTPAFAVAVDAMGKTVMMNDAMCHALGYRLEEVKGSDYLTTFIPERERKKLATVFKTLHTARESTATENLILARDGRELLVEWHGSQVFNTQGEFEFLFGVGIDITERRRVEHALYESEQRYRTLYTTTNEGLAVHEIIYDASGQALDYEIVDVNPAFESIVGIKREDAIGRRASDLYGTGEAPYLETYAEVARSGKPANFETTFEPMDRSFSVAAFSPGKGKFATLFADITERKKAQDALQQSEARFRALFEQAAVGVGQIVTETGQFLRLNQKYCDIVGYNQDEMEALTFQKITHPADLQADLDNMENLKQGLTREFSMEKRYYRKDGSIVWVNLTVSPMWRVGEEPDYHIAVVEDITRQKQAQEKLADYQERLRSLASELSLTEEHERRKMAGYLHDGPCQQLAVSLLKLETMRASLQRPDKQPMTEICKMIQQTVLDLRNLTFDLSPPTLYLVGLEAALEELLKEELRDKHNIPYDFTRGNISHLLGDDLRALLFQCVRELLNNTAKHAHAQKVTLTTHSQGDHIKLIVADDGIGFVLDNVESAVSKTGGYGLFSMRERLAYIGGQLEMWSKPGQGSRFTISVPLESNDKLG